MDGNYRRRGIGRKLTKEPESALMKKTDVIKIRSSLYAIDFYKAMGYRKTTGKRMFHGVPIQPMEKTLKKT